MNRETQARLSKVFRYLRYYPQDLWRVFQFLVRHWIACTIERNNSNQAYVRHLYRYFLKASDRQTDINFYSEQLDRVNWSRN